jgi:hypothetical protein
VQLGSPPAPSGGALVGWRKWIGGFESILSIERRHDWRLYTIEFILIMPVILEIPVPRPVKLYYEHPCNFGADMIVNQRSAVGGIITAVMSFYPLQEGELPVVWRDDTALLDILPIKLEMKLDMKMMLSHHFKALGELLEKMYEREFLAFCVGRFVKIPNYEGAVTAWGERYGLDEDDWGRDVFRKHIHRKYSKQVLRLLEMENSKRMERFQTALVERIDK